MNFGYCRVSTDEQATEGLSLDAQARKLREFAKLRELGAIQIEQDAGFSGKNLKRPALRSIRGEVESGTVEHVVVWKIDRLSRSVSDLDGIVGLLRKNGTLLHSVMEPLDLSSASGRMQFGISGVMAQWYRENLSENVQLGMHQAILSGRHPNKPKFGYSLHDGILVPNEEAVTVRKIFLLRADGRSLREIEEATGVKYSTVSSVLKHRVYLGEIPSHGAWYPGKHQPLLSEEEWQAAQRPHLPGRRRSQHYLSKVVRCGICGRVATVKYPDADRSPLFVCKHRGTGCRQPARTSSGLEKAALLGIRLLTKSQDMVTAIRRELARGLEPDRASAPGSALTGSLARLERKRRKLLDLFYDDRISSDLFVQEEKRLANKLETARDELHNREIEREAAAKAAAEFERALPVIEELDVDSIWEEASDAEKRVLIEDLVKGIWFFPDHLEVEVVGVPKMNVSLEEVGLNPPVGDCSCRRGDLNPHTLAGTSPSS